MFDDKYTAVYYERDNSANPEGLTTVFNHQKFELVSQNMFWLSDTPDEMRKGWGGTTTALLVKNLQTAMVPGGFILIFMPLPPTSLCIGIWRRLKWIQLP